MLKFQVMDQQVLKVNMFFISETEEQSLCWSYLALAACVLRMFLSLAGVSQVLSLSCLHTIRQ